MKRKIKYSFFFVLALLFAACQKEMMSYEGKEGVYFAVRHGATHLSGTSWPYQPYSTVDFVRLGVQEVEFEVVVAITGPVKNYDRIFRVEVNPDSTTAVLGQHYAALQQDWIMPAGATSTKIAVRVFRTDDLEAQSRVIGLRLLPTADFELSFPEFDAIPALNGGIVVAKFDASLHNVNVTDVMQTPAVWSGSIQPGNRESGLFGVFSRRKMEFLEQNLGVTYQDFSSAETMPMARMMLIAQDGSNILIQRFNEGNPVLEDDGRLMWMGTVPWTSYLGVPYTP